MFYCFINIFSLGILGLVNRWTKKSLQEKTIYQKVEDLDKASHIVFIDHYQVKRFVWILKKKVILKENFELDTYVFFNDY